jgi:hypothetical protein
MGHNRLQIIILSLTLASTSIMCSIFSSSQTPTPEPEKHKATIASLQLTVAAIEQSSATSTPEPTKGQPFPTMIKPPSGSITGNVSFPSEVLPKMRVVAVNIKTGETFSTDVIDQKSYILSDIPLGTYHVMAYLEDKSNAASAQGAGYSNAVPCGLKTNCTDHNLIDVEVREGVPTSGINPGDWYAPAGSFPPDPIQ